MLKVKNSFQLVFTVKLSLIQRQSRIVLNMHFAVALWGLLRSTTYTIQGFREMCLQPILQLGHTYELFVHTYNFTHVYENTRNNERGIHLNFSEWKLLDADVVLIENQDAFDAKFPFSEYETHGDPWSNNFTSFRNNLRALHSLYRVTQAVESASKVTHYDGVVFLRPDVQYLVELPVHLLSSHHKTLFLPGFHRSCRGGQYNDRMAMGDLNSSLIYGRRIEGALEYSKQHWFHSETYLYDYLTNRQVKVKEIPFVFKRMRANGAVENRERDLRKPGELINMTCIEYNVTELPLTDGYKATHSCKTMNGQVIDSSQTCSPYPLVSYQECERLKSLAMMKAANRTRSRKNMIQMARLHVQMQGISADSTETVHMEKTVFKSEQLYHETKVNYI